MKKTGAIRKDSTVTQQKTAEEQAIDKIASIYREKKIDLENLKKGIDSVTDDITRILNNPSVGIQNLPEPDSPDPRLDLLTSISLNAVEQKLQNFSIAIKMADKKEEDFNSHIAKIAENTKSLKDFYDKLIVKLQLTDMLLKDVKDKNQSNPIDKKLSKEDIEKIMFSKSDLEMYIKNVGEANLNRTQLNINYAIDEKPKDDLEEAEDKKARRKKLEEELKVPPKYSIYNQEVSDSDEEISPTL